MSPANPPMVAPISFGDCAAPRRSHSQVKTAPGIAYLRPELRHHRPLETNAFSSRERNTAIIATATSNKTPAGKRFGDTEYLLPGRICRAMESARAAAARARLATTTLLAETLRTCQPYA